MNPGRFLRLRALQAERWIARRLPVRILGVEITFPGAVEALARAGYAARGFVYVSMGSIALLAAVELAPSARDGLGALLTLAQWPAGYLWLSAIALALSGFAAWRAAQVIFDADNQGSRPWALGSRAGQAISGVVYGALAMSVFELLDEIEDVREGDIDTAAEQAAEVLGWPGGHLVLIGVGVFIAGAGLGNIIQGLLSDFGKRLGCPDGTRRWAGWVGRVGYVARGFAFLPLGWFLIEAGLDLDPGDARDLGGALQSLEAQPFGSWVMGATAVGLIAFGLFAFIEARYRCIEPRDPLAE